MMPQKQGIQQFKESILNASTSHSASLTKSKYMYVYLMTPCHLVYIHEL